MIAVHGEYDNGRIRLSEKPPMDKAQVLVIFPENNKGKQLSLDAARKVFNDFTGSVNRNIDIKQERLGALDEKYASSN